MAPSRPTAFLTIVLLAFPMTCSSREAIGLDRSHGICKGDAPQYSGYINVAPGVDYFYYLALSRSAQPFMDPLVLWLTGGPGCSSMFALLSENGPCRVDPDRSRGTNGSLGDGWVRTRNPFSWTEVANVVWVDQPVGVGFSSMEASELMANERQLSDRMLAFLYVFYAEYAQFLKVPLYIMGESYGGHYVPAIAKLVLEHGSSGVGNLAGIALGNAFVDPEIQYLSRPIMAYTGGDGGSLKRGVVNKSVFHEMKMTLRQCEMKMRRCHELRLPCVEEFNVCEKAEIDPVKQAGRNPYDLRKTCDTSGAEQDFCYNLRTEREFLNDANIKFSLGVPLNKSWTICNTTVSSLFASSGDQLLNFRSSIKDLLIRGINVLVYAGDTDYMIDWVGCKAWLQHLRWPHQKAWMHAPQLDFMVQKKKRGMKQEAWGLTFIQLYNAGHFAPMDQPEAALAMIREFIGRGSPRNRVGSFGLSFASLCQVSTGSLVAIVALCLVGLSVSACRSWKAAARMPIEIKYSFLACD